jgi:hypothetical protein
MSVHFKWASDRKRIAVTVVSILGAALLAACDVSVTLGPPARDWVWTDLGGPGAETPERVANHATLVLVGDALLLGTADGVWRRPLEGDAAWERAGLDGRAIHAVAITADGARVVAAGFDPRDESAPTAWYSTTAGADWTAAAVWPRGAPGSLFAAHSFPFATLEPDPHDPSVVYGGLDADSVAVTVDGGATWVFTDGADEPNFGYPCVAHRPANALVLLQGCELPLDVAWIGARTIIDSDRFTLTDFRFLFGYPEDADLGNRRINSIVAPPARPGRVLVGVEGGLVELTSNGEWSSRSDIDARWIYLSHDESLSRPYAYIRAIAPLGETGRPVLFGGTVNGTNQVLSLFEENGGIVRRLDAPFALTDPRVEQAVRLDAADVLLVISEAEDDGRRTSKVYRLRRP